MQESFLPRSYMYSNYSIIQYKLLHTFVSTVQLQNLLTCNIVEFWPSVSFGLKCWWCSLAELVCNGGTCPAVLITSTCCCVCITTDSWWWWCPFGEVITTVGPPLSASLWWGYSIFITAVDGPANLTTPTWLACDSSLLLLLLRKDDSCCCCCLWFKSGDICCKCCCCWPPMFNALALCKNASVFTVIKLTRFRPPSSSSSLLQTNVHIQYLTYTVIIITRY